VKLPHFADAYEPGVDRLIAEAEVIAFGRGWSPPLAG